MTGTDLAVPEVIDAVEVQPVGNLFGTHNPAEVVERATATADALIDVVRKKNLIKRIGQSDHVLVEAWTLLGSMLGVFPVVVWTKPFLKDGKPHGWEARVEARTLNGQTVGAAEAECTRDEAQWGWEPKGRDGRTFTPRDDYALRSMAQTRAVSKAMRGPLGFIVQLAGFNPTPAEEMPSDGSLSESDGAAAARNPSPSGSESDPVLTFGKHKGKRVSETPADYRKWMVENFEPRDEHGTRILEAIKDSLIPF